MQYIVLYLFFFCAVYCRRVGYYDKLETIVGVLYGKQKNRYNGMLPIRPRPATYEKLVKKSFVGVISMRVQRSTGVQALAPSAHVASV